MKKTVKFYRLSAIYKDVFYSDYVTRKSQKDILVKSVKINNCSCVKKRKKKISSLHRGHKLFLSKNRFEVVRVDYGITSIFPFRIHILLSSKSIQFDAKITRTKSDNKVELREILGLLCLFLGQHFDSRKILKVFIVHNHINRRSQTF